MKTAIVCTRGRVQWKRTLRAIKESGFHVTEVVTWPRQKMVKNLRTYCDRHNIRLKVFKTHWEESKLAAPGVRDRKIVDYADCVIAIWDYQSPDVRDFLSKSFAANKPTHVHII